ncbi:MAG TPA: UDP-glucose/GDP-mannose dehydrogenase family protein [Acidobacteriaceae bacterium]|nr:UDP-glucose/GDP-mannose dehydrogenase family protein [Acidobacteriaceae bacterium]
MSNSIRIAVVGSGYVGLVAALCFAEMGHDVVCVDKDECKTAALEAGEIPVHERYLAEMLHRHRHTRIRFTNGTAEAMTGAQAIFIAVGTPQTETGWPDLSNVEAVVCDIARSLTSYMVIVEKSTVPVCTNEWIGRTLERHGVARSLFDVVSNPEFLREGTAVEDFLHPDRIVVGSDSESAARVLARIYEPLTSGVYYDQTDAVAGFRSSAAPPPLLNTSTKSAEIIKHASNAFLALKISFINAVSNVCELAGADIEQVAEGMGLDKRIGARFLRAGIGYGGSCFPKDIAAFRSVAEELGVDFGLLKEVERINANQQRYFLAKLRAALGSLRDKRLGVFGLAFKGGTDDIRESPAIALVESLLVEGCAIVAYDPAAMGRAELYFKGTLRPRYAEDAYSASQDVDAVLILTDWADFRELDLERLRMCMRSPMIIDGRNMFDPAAMERLGFTYISVGRPAVDSRHVGEPAVTAFA